MYSRPCCYQLFVRMRSNGSIQITKIYRRYTRWMWMPRSIGLWRSQCRVLIRIRTRSISSPSPWMWPAISPRGIARCRLNPASSSGQQLWAHRRIRKSKRDISGRRPTWFGGFGERQGVSPPSAILCPDEVPVGGATNGVDLGQNQN